MALLSDIFSKLIRYISKQSFTQSSATANGNQLSTTKNESSLNPIISRSIKGLIGIGLISGLYAIANILSLFTKRPNTNSDKNPLKKRDLLSLIPNERGPIFQIDSSTCGYYSYDPFLFGLNSTNEAIFAFRCNKDIYGQRITGTQTLGFLFAASNGGVRNSYPCGIDLGDASFVLAWTHMESNFTTICAQRYSSDRTTPLTKGSRFCLSNPQKILQAYQAITKVPDGFAMSWFSQNNTSSDFWLSAARFNSSVSDTPVIANDIIHIDSITKYDMFASTIAYSPKSEQLVIAYPIFPYIYANFYSTESGAFTLVGEPLIINSIASYGHQTCPLIILSPNQDKFFISWLDFTYGLTGQLYDATKKTPSYSNFIGEQWTSGQSSFDYSLTYTGESDITIIYAKTVYEIDGIDLKTTDNSLSTVQNYFINQTDTYFSNTITMLGSKTALTCWECYGSPCSNNNRIKCQSFPVNITETSSSSAHSSFFSTSSSESKSSIHSSHSASLSSFSQSQTSSGSTESSISSHSSNSPQIKDGIPNQLQKNVNQEYLISLENAFYYQYQLDFQLTTEDSQAPPDWIYYNNNSSNPYLIYTPPHPLENVFLVFACDPNRIYIKCANTTFTIQAEENFNNLTEFYSLLVKLSGIMAPIAGIFTTPFGIILSTAASITGWKLRQWHKEHNQHKHWPFAEYVRRELNLNIGSFKKGRGQQFITAIYGGTSAEGIEAIEGLQQSLCKHGLELKNLNDKKLKELARIIAKIIQQHSPGHTRFFHHSKVTPEIINDNKDQIASEAIKEWLEFISTQQTKYRRSLLIEDDEYSILKDYDAEELMETTPTILNPRSPKFVGIRQDLTP